MDMAVLGAKCVFVPTPGQYEQVVLARELSAAGYAAAISESSLTAKTLQGALASGLKPLPSPASGMLGNAVDAVLEKIKK
jgi:UDP-N-acetylglucosamine:LPS N-acetylglucosamine transferase